MRSTDELDLVCLFCRYDCWYCDTSEHSFTGCKVQYHLCRCIAALCVAQIKAPNHHAIIDIGPKFTDGPLVFPRAEDDVLSFRVWQRRSEHIPLPVCTQLGSLAGCFGSVSKEHKVSILLPRPSLLIVGSGARYLLLGCADCVVLVMIDKS